MPLAPHAVNVLRRWVGSVGRAHSAIRILVLVILSLMLVGGTAVAVAGGASRGAASTASKDSSPKDPISQLPQEQQAAARRKVMQDVKDAQPAFVAQFIASGRDVHSLPAGHLPAMGAPQTSGPADALARSTAVVQGKVTRQVIARDEVVSEFEVSAVLAGKIGVPTISVSQNGGPFLNGNTAVLQESLIDPILWTGREYVLFVAPCREPNAARFCMSAGGEQIEVSGGVLRSTSIEDSTVDWTAGYSGRPVADLVASLAEAR